MDTGRRLEWISVAGIGALISAVALTASGVSLALGHARWGPMPSARNPVGQLAYAAAHPGFLPFVYLLLAVSTLLLLAVVAGLYLVLARHRPRAARLISAIGVVGALVGALSTIVQALQWAALAADYAAGSPGARLADARALQGPALTVWSGPVELAGYGLIAVWIVAAGVLLWPLSRDVRALAVISVVTGAVTVVALPALALWTFVAGIWLLSPGPRLALARQ